MNLQKKIISPEKSVSQQYHHISYNITVTFFLCSHTQSAAAKESQTCIGILYLCIPFNPLPSLNIMYVHPATSKSTRI